MLKQKFTVAEKKARPMEYTAWANEIIKQGYIPAFDGIFFYAEKKTKVLEKKELNELRNRRQIECFNIINRGTLWYQRLTDDQVAQLKIWYEAWLDVTITKIVPTKPYWLE